MNKFFKTGIVLLNMCVVSVARGETIQIVTEEYPPYNYSDGGQIIGVGTEVVLAVLDELNMNLPVSVYPWARAYKMALENPNVLIYTISRMPEREHLFKWVGVITPVDQCLFSLKGKGIEISEFADLRHFEIGTVIDDVQERYLITRGFPKDKIQSNTSIEANFRKLLKGRVDLWAVLELAAYHIVKQHNLDPRQTIQKVWCMQDLSVEGDYMAFGRNTSDELVRKFQQALQRVKQKGAYSSILQKYRS